MKKIILLFSLLISFTLFSQSEIEVEKLLLDKYSQEKPWTFVQDTLHRFRVPFINTKLTSKEFFRTVFSFFDDRHGFSRNSIVMFDKNTHSVVMLEPMSINEEFYKEFIGFVFVNKKEIKRFTKEFESILMNDDKMRVIERTIIKENLISFEIRISHQKDLHEIVEILLNKNKIIEIRSLTPKWKNISVSIK